MINILEDPFEGDEVKECSTAKDIYRKLTKVVLWYFLLVFGKWNIPRNMCLSCNILEKLRYEMRLIERVFIYLRIRLSTRIKYKFWSRVSLECLLSTNQKMLINCHFSGLTSYAWALFNIVYKPQLMIRLLKTSYFI